MAGSVKVAMVLSCCVVGCTNGDMKENHGKGIKFYRILVISGKWRPWLVATGRKSFDTPPDVTIHSVKASVIHLDYTLIKN